MTSPRGKPNHPDHPASASYLRRLDRLVRVLLDAKFTSGDALWELQTDLLCLQQDIQQSIADSKATTRRSSGAQQELSALRTVRWHSRRFGDAFAWVLLGLDRQIINPLAQNSAVAIPSDGHGTQGVLAIAPTLANEGWGFPILHDITDCLRIGDITFVRPGKPPTTVEVKTRLVRERVDHDGRSGFDYEVTLISTSDTAPPNIDLYSVAKAEEVSNRRPDSRLERQVQRLSTARAHQLAEPGISEIAGKRTITAHVQPPCESNFSVLQRVARLARRNGYASAAADDTFLYTAIYDGSGLDPEKFPDLASALPGDLLTSGILFEENPERNSICLYTIPTEYRGGVHRWLPFFLYSLPKTTILDLLHGRMIIAIVVNWGRIIEALADADFGVVSRATVTKLTNGSLVLSSHYSDPLGGSFVIELHNLRVHIDEMIMEFKSLSYLIEIAQAMRSGAGVVASQRRGA